MSDISFTCGAGCDESRRRDWNLDMAVRCQCCNNPVARNAEQVCLPCAVRKEWCQVCQSPHKLPEAVSKKYVQALLREFDEAQASLLKTYDGKIAAFKDEVWQYEIVAMQSVPQKYRGLRMEARQKFDLLPGAKEFCELLNRGQEPQTGQLADAWRAMLCTLKACNEAEKQEWAAAEAAFAPFKASYLKARHDRDCNLRRAIGLFSLQFEYRQVIIATHEKYRVSIQEERRNLKAVL